MWNPFRRAELKPVPFIQQDSNLAVNNIALEQETEVALLRSLKARNEVASMYERLASEALCKIKGGGICPES